MLMCIQITCGSCQNADYDSVDLRWGPGTIFFTSIPAHPQFLSNTLMLAPPLHILSASHSLFLSTPTKNSKSSTQ